MRIRLVFYIVICAVFMVSCGSNKNVVNRGHKKVVLQEKEEVYPELPQLEQIEKPLKTNSNHTVAYIQKFARIAVKKMHEHNIPASITLAQGVLESGSGRSKLAIKSNNHFGIKCHRGWKGKSVTHDDDEKGECFRKYKYPETSYEDHSQFLISRKRYASLFKLGSQNYKGWAYGLRRAGYATDKRYPQKLITIIKKYNLTVYDKMGARKLNKGNQIKVKSYKVQKGDTLYSIARRHSISVANLKRANGLSTNEISIGQDLLIK